MLWPSTPIFDNLPLQISHSLQVYIQSLTAASGSRLFGSAVGALNFYLDKPGMNPTKGGIFFQLCFILCYDFHVLRWRLVRDQTLFSRKWLPVIINDDFLEKGECYSLPLLPSIICLGRFHIACRYMCNL